MSFWVNWYELVDKTVLKLDTRVDLLVATKLATWQVASVETFVKSVWGDAGINASYFCPDEAAYTYCWRDGHTTAETIIKWVLYAQYGDDTWGRGIIWVTSGNVPLYVQNNKWYVPGSYEGNSNAKSYSDLYYGLWNFPVLLDKWVDVVYESDDLIDAKMKSTQVKNFICITEDNRYIYMWFVYGKTMYDMPAYLKSQYWCYYAVNLDGGWSTSLYVDGSYILKWWRDVANAYVIKTQKGPANALTSSELLIAQRIAAKNYPLNSVMQVYYKVLEKAKVETKYIRVSWILEEVLRLMKL